MARNLALLFLCLPLALPLSAQTAAAQGVTPVWPGPPVWLAPSQFTCPGIPAVARSVAARPK